MRIAIVGFDTEGRATYEYLKARGHELTVCDQNPDTVVPDGAETQLGDDYLADLGRFDRVVRTPGLHPAKIIAKNPDITPKITSHINIFLEDCPTKNVIGVTGTKGKGTTSSLIVELLKADGKTVFLGGNIGVPPLTFVQDITEDSWVVLELSSFQLIDLRHSPHIAVCLMVVPEHLDWHEDYEEYVAAKQQLFINQAEDDIAIYYAENDDSLSIADASLGTTIPYYQAPGAEVRSDTIVMGNQVICPTQEIRLLGEHNLQNVCAALTAVWQVSQNASAFREVLAQFGGLEHRLEFVRELDDVRYYDDSFGTTPATAIVALEAFTAPKVLIVGGSDKGVTFTELATAIAQSNVRAVIAIGKMGPVIANELRKAGYKDIVEGADNMESIVLQARQAAEPGDIVLLSTACASFDMFKNYKDRGDQFKNAVRALE